MSFDPERAIQLAAEGKTLRQIAGALGCDMRKIHQMMAESATFAGRFARARKNGLELLADDLVTAHTDDPDIQRAKLKSENVRWLLARRLPAQYGDRLAVDVSGQIDLAAALRDANARLQPISDQRAAAIVHDAEFKELSAPKPADTESVAIPEPGGIYD